MKKTLAALVLVLFAVGCVSTSAVRLGVQTSRPPVFWKSVAVFQSAEDVPGPYQEVALLTATGEALWTNEGQMWNSLKKKAGKLGANGVILDATSEPTSAAKLASAFLGVAGAQRKGKAIAIYFTQTEKETP